MLASFFSPAPRDIKLSLRAFLFLQSDQLLKPVQTSYLAPEGITRNVRSFVYRTNRT